MLRPILWKPAHKAVTPPLSPLTVSVVSVRNEWTELACAGDAAPEELEEHTMVAHKVHVVPERSWSGLVLPQRKSLSSVWFSLDNSSVLSYSPEERIWVCLVLLWGNRLGY